VELETDRQEDGATNRPLATRLIGLTLLLYIAAAALSAHIGRFADFTAWFLYAEDRWLLLAQTAILAAALIGLTPGRRAILLSRRTCLALALGAIPACYLGHYWALCGYAVSRDEQLAIFDSVIFGRGLLAQPLAVAWQNHIAALNSLFLLPASHPIGWVSAYLPINAALRALVGQLLDPALANPLLTALGGVALWKCARRLWPDDAEAATVALLLYLGSGQVLFAGMSAYAMPAHLTFNLLWLWLFLIDRRWSDVAALAVAGLAVGLHQPLFHPLFVAPFMALLLSRRNWGRLAFFILGYAMICAFWFAWPHWIYATIEGGNPTAPPVDTDFWARLRAVLANQGGQRWTDMSANLLRCVAWQPLLLLPLFAAGVVRVRRNPIALALVATSILPVIVMAILLPDQGQGFGYRYVHPALGAAILAAVFGWRHLVERDARWRPLAIRTLIGGALLLLPAQYLMTRDYYAAFARTDARIVASRTDYFIIGNDDAPSSGALVINRADLTNRPLRLFADKIDPDLIHLMCDAHGRVGMPTSAFYAPINRYFRGTIISRSSDRRIAALGPQLTSAGCRVVVVGGGT